VILVGGRRTFPFHWVPSLRGHRFGWTRPRTSLLSCLLRRHCRGLFLRIGFFRVWWGEPWVYGLKLSMKAPICGGKIPTDRSYDLELANHAENNRKDRFYVENPWRGFRGKTTGRERINSTIMKSITDGNYRWWWCLEEDDGDVCLVLGLLSGLPGLSSGYYKLYIPWTVVQFFLLFWWHWWLSTLFITVPHLKEQFPSSKDRGVTVCKINISWVCYARWRRSGAMNAGETVTNRIHVFRVSTEEDASAGAEAESAE